MYLSLKIESNKLSLFLLKLSELFVTIYWLQLKRSYQYPFIQYLGISNNPFYNFFYLIISCEKMIPKNKGINCSVRNNISYNNRGRGIWIIGVCWKYQKLSLFFWKYQKLSLDNTKINILKFIGILSQGKIHQLLSYNRRPRIQFRLIYILF